MRASDLRIAVAAAFLAFGAVATTAAGAPWYVVGPFFALALAVLVYMDRRQELAPHVVIVGDRHDDLVRQLRDRLDRRELGVRFCPGPDKRRGGCPVFAGEPCPLADHDVATLVFRAAGDERPLPPCEEGIGVPLLVFDEASDPDATVDSVARPTAPDARGVG